jgi:hypothetical protein
MKKTIIFILLLVTGRTFAQVPVVKDTAVYKNHFYLNPFELFLKTFEVTYEHDCKNSGFALDAGLEYEKYTKPGYNNSNSGEDSKKLLTGFDSQLQYRFYLFNKATRRQNFQNILYFAPYLTFKYVDLSSANYYQTAFNPTNGTYSGFTVQTSGNVRSYGGGLVIGFRISGLNNRFCAGAYLGGGFKSSDVRGNAFGSSDYQINNDAFSGITPKVGVQAGISF